MKHITWFLYLDKKPVAIVHTWRNIVGRKIAENKAKRAHIVHNSMTGIGPANDAMGDYLKAFTNIDTIVL